jgi:hypothetical protein
MPQMLKETPSAGKAEYRFEKGLVCDLAESIANEDSVEGLTRRQLEGGEKGDSG